MSDAEVSGAGRTQDYDASCRCDGGFFQADGTISEICQLVMCGKRVTQSEPHPPQNVMKLLSTPAAFQSEFKRLMRKRQP